MKSRTKSSRAAKAKSSHSRDVILIVDLQAGFEPPASLVQEIEKYSRTFGRRVFTRFVNPTDSLFRKQLDYQAMNPGTAETELLLRPTGNDLVLYKSGYGLSIHHIRRLKKLKFREIVVCGLETDACVLAVLFSLFDAGFSARINPEFCRSFSSDSLHEPALKIIRRQFGKF